MAQGVSGPPRQRKWSQASVSQSQCYKSAYGDAKATEVALCRCLVGDQDTTRNEVENSMWCREVLNLLSDTSGAMVEFKNRQWHTLSRDRWWYAQWQSWREAHDSFQLGPYRFAQFFKNRIPVETTESDCWAAYTSWTNIRLGRRLMTTANGYVGWVSDHREGQEVGQVHCGDRLIMHYLWLHHSYRPSTYSLFFFIF